MKLEILTKEQVEKLYTERLSVDFPKAELKPLETILDAIEKRSYTALGFFDESEIVGYSFMIKHRGVFSEKDSDYLVDYFAVYPEHRCKGVGSKMLELLMDYLKEAGEVYGEVEDPDYAQDAESKELQIRRMNFYLKNGCVDTGLEVKSFGVPFRIIKLKGYSDEDDEDMEELDEQEVMDDLWFTYKLLYSCVISEENVWKNIKRLPNKWEKIAEPVVKEVVDRIAAKDCESLLGIVDNPIEDLTTLNGWLDSFLEGNEMEAFDSYGVDVDYSSVPKTFDYNQQTCWYCDDATSFSIDYDLTVNGELSDMTLQLEFNRQDDGTFAAHIIDVHIL